MKSASSNPPKPVDNVGNNGRQMSASASKGTSSVGIRMNQDNSSTSSSSTKPIATISASYKDVVEENTILKRRIQDAEERFASALNDELFEDGP